MVEKKETKTEKIPAADSGDGKKEVKPTKKDKKDEKKPEDELSEEDQKLSDELNMLVERLSENDASLYDQALESMRSLIRASTTSMTSVPKPLKFMMPHFPKMKEIHEKIQNNNTKRFCADVISALAMTSEGTRECLQYRLLGKKEPIGDWGHEYVRHLANELGEEWKLIEEGKASDQKRVELIDLCKEIVAHNMRHSAEAEACDLLLEGINRNLELDI